MTMRENIIDPALLSSISHLELIAYQAVEGAVSGLHHSHFMGRNVEFNEHRPYNPGDELRYIDWRVFAKTERFHIKQYEEDTNLRVTILTDLSGSMHYAESSASKHLYAQQLTAALSHLLLSQGDSVGLVVFDSRVQEYIPPRNRSEQWGAMLEVLARASYNHEESAISQVLAGLGEFIKKRGMVILISDLIEDPQQVMHSLALLRKNQQEVLVFQILSPEEIDLPFSGTVEFHPLEGEIDPLRTIPKRLLKNYKERVDHFLKTYRDGCLEHGIDYNLVRTDRPLDVFLREYLQRRMKTRYRQ